MRLLGHANRLLLLQHAVGVVLSLCGCSGRWMLGTVEISLGDPLRASASATGHAELAFKLMLFKLLSNRNLTIGQHRRSRRTRKYSKTNIQIDWAHL
jgi:hypothetical protein